jgi:DNA-binding IclR family transcriptional regulator
MLLPHREQVVHIMEVTGAQSAYRVLDLLTQVAMHPEGVTGSDASRTVGLTLPTAHRLLRVLCDRGFAVHNKATGKYRPGPQIRVLAGDGIDHGLLADIARPSLVKLRDTTNETVFLSVRDGMHLSYLECITSSHSVQMYGAVGKRVPLHATSQGKVILAFLPDGVAERLVRQLGYEKYTDNTITSVAGLIAEIEEVRRTGYALNLEERELGVRSVAAPVLDSGGTVVASVCVGGPVFRVSEDHLRHQFADLTRATAGEITLLLGEQAGARSAVLPDAEALR